MSDHRAGTPRVGRRMLLSLVVASAALSSSGCSWFTDFKQQPKIDPWETAADSIPPRGNPQMSVPVYGSYAPELVYDRRNLPTSIDQFDNLQNPTPPNAASLENGRKQYQINCAPCHGVKGDGMGTAVKYGFIPFPLTGPATLARTDGYIFGMIRNGRGMMPTYNRIEEMDRWDIVNYVRGLQGRLATPVVAAPVALPGVTGAAVPGPSVTAPTRPAPFYKQVGAQAMLREQRPGQAPDTGAVVAPAAAADTTTRGRQP